MDNKNFLRKSKDRNNRGRYRKDRDKNRDRDRKDRDRRSPSDGKKSNNRRNKNEKRSDTRKKLGNIGVKYTNDDDKLRQSKSNPRKLRERKSDHRNFTTKRGQAKNFITGRPPLGGQKIIYHNNGDKRRHPIVSSNKGEDDFIRVVTREVTKDRDAMFDELSDSLSRKFNTAQPYEPQIGEDEETEGFLFVYEANGVYFRSLNDIDKADGRLVTIYPVFYAGYNNTTFSEEVTYDESKDKYVAKEENRSWLDVIYNYPEVVYSMDISKAIVYDEKLFHCDGDLSYYLLGSEPETVDITGKTEATDNQIEH